MSATRILWGQIAVVLTIVLITMWAATQWTAFQLSLVADQRYHADADAITRFTRGLTLNVPLVAAASPQRSWRGEFRAAIG